jgi:parallel beta-helix repeat protein
MFSRIRMYLGVAVYVGVSLSILPVHLSAQTLQASSFGAKCDGSSDDTAALNAAIQAASAQSAVLTIGSGTCLQKQVLVGAPVTIRIVNGAVLKLADAANTKQFLIRASNVTLSGDGTGILDGNSSHQSQASDQIMVDPGVSNVTIEHIRFQNTKGSHIRSKGVSGPVNTHIIIRDDTFQNAAASAVYLNWETTDSTIDNNKFLGGHGNAISVYNHSPHSQIDNNQISDYDRMAIEVWNGGQGAQVENNNIKLTCAGVRSWGISMDRSPDSLVKNNQINCAGNNGFNGIEIVGSDNSQVADNTISGFGTGMSIDRSSNVKVTGNTISSTGAGIIIGSSVAGQHIRANWIEGNKIVLRGAGKGVGVRLMCNAANADCSGNTIVDNDITGGGGSGAYSGVSTARYAGALDKTVIALNRFGGIAKPVAPEAGTKPKLLGNHGAPSANMTATANSASRIQSDAGDEENDDRAGRLALTNGQASYQFKSSYTKPPECIAVSSATRKRLTEKTTTTNLTITGPSGDSALYVCHAE